MQNTDRHPLQVQKQLRRLAASFRADRTRLIRDAFPEVWRDAQTLVCEGGYYLPWEHAVAFVGGKLGAILDRYDVPPARHRPSPDSVPPLTDIFCEACSLVFEELTDDPQRRSDGNIFDEIRSRNANADQDEVAHDVAEALAEVRAVARAREERDQAQ